MYLHGNSFTERLCKYLLYELTGSQSIKLLEALPARLTPFAVLWPLLVRHICTRVSYRPT